MRILIAEDNLVNRELLVYILAASGHTVVLAEDGKSAVKMHAKANVDLILMDLWMPEMDGLTAARHIRANESGTGRRVPIIAVTAHAIKGDRESCLQAGMDMYLTKPIRRDEILETINRYSQELSPKANPSSEPILASWDGVDREILSKLGSMMVESSHQSVVELKAAFAAKDWKKMASVAHTLRGSLGLFGAKKTGSLLAKLERAVSDGRLDELDELLPLFFRELGLVLEIISRRATGSVDFSRIESSPIHIPSPSPPLSN